MGTLPARVRVIKFRRLRRLPAAPIARAFDHYARGVDGRVATQTPDVELAEVVDQICERVTLGCHRLTPRRVVRAIFGITRARRDRGLPPYPAALVNAAIWLLVTDDDR